jgi:hypothetical protein
MNVTEAAERLRADKYEECGDFEMAHFRESNDTCDCAREYLRLTDPTPIDEAWLCACGGKAVEFERSIGSRRRPHIQKVTRILFGELNLLRRDESSFYAMLGGLDFPDPGQGLPDQATRGQFRRLCEAVGIHLEETR